LCTTYGSEAEDLNSSGFISSATRGLSVNFAFFSSHVGKSMERDEGMMNWAISVSQLKDSRVAHRFPCAVLSDTVHPLASQVVEAFEERLQFDGVWPT
jgi:hypothetical protein